MILDEFFASFGKGFFRGGGLGREDQEEGAAIEGSLASLGARLAGGEETGCGVRGFAVFEAFVTSCAAGTIAGLSSDVEGGCVDSDGFSTPCDTGLTTGEPFK